MPINIYEEIKQEDSLQNFHKDGIAEKPNDPVNIYDFIEASQEQKPDSIETGEEPARSMQFAQPEQPVQQPEVVDPYTFESKHPNLWAAGKAIADIPRGVAELGEAVVSGATLGASEQAGRFGEYLANKFVKAVTGKDVSEKAKQDKVIRPWLETTGEMAGSAAPIGAVSKTIAAPLIKKIAGSKAINAFHKMIGGAATGITYTAIEKMIKEGELPTPGEVAENGILWGALDGIFHTFGQTKKFANAIKKLARLYGISKKEALNTVLKDAKEAGAPIIKYAEEFANYQSALQKTGSTAQIDSEFLAKGRKAAEDFVASVEYKLNKTGDMAGGLKEQLKSEQKAALEQKAKLEAEKIGQPLIKPGEQKIKSRKPSELKTVIHEPVEQIPYKVPEKPLRPEQRSALAQRHKKAVEPVFMPSVKTGSEYTKSRKPRSVAQILKDVNTAVGKRGAIGKKELTQDQIEATQRIIHDAKLAGKTISKYMSDAGATPETIAKIVSNIDLLKKKPLSGGISSKIEGKLKAKIKGIGQESLKALKEGALEVDKYTGAITTRLANIDPSLRGIQQRFEHELGRNIIKDTDEILPVVKSVKKIKGSEKEALALAMNNRDASTVNKIAKKHGLNEQFKKIRTVLDSIYKKAENVGLKTGYLKNYYPRYVKNPKGLIAYFQKQPEWSQIDDMIKKTEKAVGRSLNDVETAEIIDTFLTSRSFGSQYRDGGFILKKPGAVKERKIYKLNKEMQKYYATPNEALIRYITNMNTAIAKKKYFGYSRKNAATQYSPSILSRRIAELKARGKISPEDEMLIKEMVGARMDEKGTHGFFDLVKNIMLIDVLNSPKQAITQLGDIAWSLFTSPIKTIPSLGKAILKRSDIGVKDAGIRTVSAEFGGARKSAVAVEKLMKAIGLEKIDFIGKETLMNTAIRKARSIIKKGKNVDKLVKELEPTFGKETGQLIKDLEQGKITDNVKLYAFQKLSGFQPVSLSEMPQKYLTAGNGRIFYTLKSFTLKALDVYRREAIQKMLKKGTRLEGFANLLRLTAALTMAGAGADTIKDILFNKKVDLKDNIVENLFKIAQLGKYIRINIKREGAGKALMKSIAPPTKVIDAISKDIATRGDKGGLETIRSVPYGEFYYSWLGKGSERKKEAKKKQARIRRIEKKKKSLQTINQSLL